MGEASGIRHQESEGGGKLSAVSWLWYPREESNLHLDVRSVAGNPLPHGDDWLWGELSAFRGQPSATEAISEQMEENGQLAAGRQSPPQLEVTNCDFKLATTVG